MPLRKTNNQPYDPAMDQSSNPSGIPPSTDQQMYGTDTFTESGRHGESSGMPPQNQPYDTSAEPNPPLPARPGETTHGTGINDPYTTDNKPLPARPDETSTHGTGVGVGSDAPYSTTQTTTTTQHKPGMMGKVKGAAATVHGIGEAFRGAFNSEVDRMGGSKSGYAKNKAVEEKGLNEIRQRQFQHGTSTVNPSTGTHDPTIGNTGNIPPAARAGGAMVGGPPATDPSYAADPSYVKPDAGVPGGASDTGMSTGPFGGKTQQGGYHAGATQDPGMGGQPGQGRY